LHGVDSEKIKFCIGQESKKEAQKRCQEEKLEYDEIMADYKRLIPIK
jgi:hypothetical protein